MKVWKVSGKTPPAIYIRSETEGGVLSRGIAALRAEGMHGKYSSLTILVGGAYKLEATLTEMTLYQLTDLRIPIPGTSVRPSLYHLALGAVEGEIVYVEYPEGT